MIKTSWVVMTVNSPAPKTGPMSGGEIEAFEKWVRSSYADLSLASSVASCRVGPAAYLLVRALRAGVKIEDLL